MHARSYVFYRKGCFPTQPHRDSHFVRVILSPEHQFTLAPTQALQFLSHNSAAFGLGNFGAQFPGMVLAQSAFHPRQLLLAERLATHTAHQAKGMHLPGATDKVGMPDRGSPSRSVSGANETFVHKKTPVGSGVLRLGERSESRGPGLCPLLLGKGANLNSNTMGGATD